MTGWYRYPHIGRYLQLRDGGRELLGRYIYWTLKRDGQNIPMWWDEEDGVAKFGSRGKEKPTADIDNKVRVSINYSKMCSLLEEYKDCVVYVEHMAPGRGPLQIEMPRKNNRLILIDMYDTKEQKWYSYPLLHQIAHKYKVDVVELLETTQPTSLKKLENDKKRLLQWCKVHHAEGVVGKAYYGKHQIFFKEKIDLPKLTRRLHNPKVILPNMPDKDIKSAVLQGLMECTEHDEDVRNPKYAMPRIAKHVSAQASEHFYNRPNGIFEWYNKLLTSYLKGVK